MSDSTNAIIGKGTWIDKIAFTIIEREKKLGRSTKTINVESGLGASGIPHIGSMGDAVRAFGISLALKNMGYESKLIAFSDDLDGLRKVPYGLPSWLNEHICKPVSSIPDPFGECHDSYGKHMSSLLLEGLDAAGIKYIFKSGSDVYSSGILSEQIHKILSNGQLIGDKIAESTGQQKYVKFLPFFPICQNCNRLYVANTIDYLLDERKVSYACIGNTIGKKVIEGCGYKGEVKIGGGNGKLAWKVEFAARWQALDIRFEAFGKDIMDSVRINDWVSNEILDFPHPLHVKYEMFLDKGGKKISKSAGNVLTPQMWLTYGTSQSLLLLLYKRISGTRHVGIDDIPILMDEYDYYEDLYFGKIKEPNKSKLIKLNGIYEYINNLDPPSSNTIHIPYKILVQQSELFIDPAQSVNTIEKVYERLKKYGLVKEENQEITRKISLAIQWARDFKEVEDVDQKDLGIYLDTDQKNAINEVVSELKKLSDRIEKTKILENVPELSQEVQTLIFNKAKENNLEPRELFKLFYKILINAERGPKLGNYIVDLGIKNVLNLIEKKIK